MYANYDTPFPSSSRTQSVKVRQKTHHDLDSVLLLCHQCCVYTMQSCLSFKSCMYTCHSPSILPTMFVIFSICCTQRLGYFIDHLYFQQQQDFRQKLKQVEFLKLAGNAGQKHAHARACGWGLLLLLRRGARYRAAMQQQRSRPFFPECLAEQKQAFPRVLVSCTSPASSSMSSISS